MRISLSLVVLAASAVCGLVTPTFEHVEVAVEERDTLIERTNKDHSSPKPDWKPLVTSKLLQKQIKTRELFKKGEILQQIAYASPDRNRAIGTLGHNNTVKYLEKYLKSKTMSSYYNFYKQGFPLPKAEKSSLLVNGVAVEAFAMVDAPAVKVTAPLYLVPELACNVSDFAAFPAGSIAVVLRGVFVLAGQAGAVGVVYRNNVAGADIRDVSLPQDTLPGELVASVMISLENGDALAAKLTAGEKLTADLETSYTTHMTYNVIAETKEGDHNNVLLVCN